MPIFRARLLALGLCLALAGASATAQQSGAINWPQWGGPTRDFHSPSTGLADAWPESGPPVLWSRPLGVGHSSIVVDDGRLFTLYRSGNARGKVGPWKTDEVVVALDAKTGETIWEHAYPARTGFEDFSFGPGPHATPLVVGDRVFTTGTNQQLFAFDKRSGKVLWSHDFVKEFKSPELLIRPVVKAGYGCSPLAYRDTILCSVGGPGQSVMAFRQSDGAVVWKSGDFLTSGAAPILIEIAGRTQAVFLGGGAVFGLDPSSGEILWTHPHDPGNDLNCTTPLFGRDNVLFLSSAYQAGSRAIRLTPRGSVSNGSYGTDVEELWFTNRVRFMFLGAIRIGDHIYGTTGDFGPAFLTALDLKTGQSSWQVRGFQRASLLHADGKVIVMNEDGDLALTKMTPAGAEILSRTKLFDTVSWTAPVLAGTTLYARDREKIVALDLGVPGAKPAAATAAPRAAAAPIGAPPPPPVPNEFMPGLAGSWALDTAGSAINAEVPFAGLVAKGAPTWLFVTLARNGSLVLESNVNTSRARFYRPNATTTTDVAGGTITMKATWSGNTLNATGEINASSGAKSSVQETIRRDGDALVVEIRAGDLISRLRYTRLTEIGPCLTWAAPCKKPG